MREEHGSVRPPDEWHVRGKCDGCGAPKPATGWRLLELWTPTGKRRDPLANVLTWQLCLRCARRFAKRGPR